jgi:hypothetical protein
MTKEQAIKNLITGIKLAQERGIFNLESAAALYQSILVVEKEFNIKKDGKEIPDTKTKKDSTTNSK